MRKRTWRLALMAAALLAATGAQAATIEEDFDRAAQLHRSGETAQAIAIWQYWAERGDADAAYNLGLIHQYGDGVPQDEKQAIHWYRLAAERGDRIAYYMVRLLDPKAQLPMPEGHSGMSGDDAQARAWQDEAARLIQGAEWREALDAAQRRDEQVVRDLRRRAGLPEATPSPEETSD